jgi:anti-sigma factor RsiW
MTHRRASRLLSALLDGTLSPSLRRSVAHHAHGCPGCRRRLREHEAVEALVRLLPHSIVPCEPSRSAQRRLWALAAWFVDPVARARERMGLSAVGLGVFVLAAGLSVTVTGWQPAPGNGFLVLAQLTPDTAAMLPLGWR